MNGSHYTDDQLIERLYLGLPADRHLADCAGCGRRLQAFSKARLSAQTSPDIPAGFLAGQRRRIFARVEAPAPGFARLSPVAAVAALVVAAVLMSRPAPPPALLTLAANEGGVFSEMYNLLESDGPRAAEPIRGLFQEKQ